jgi:YbbR domain-containing protein
MSWVVNNWRLKLLALGLAVVLVFAVGYSQYPVQTITVDAKVNYNNEPPVGLVVNGPPVTSKVAISGLASDVRAAIVTVDVDLSKLKEGTAVVVSPIAHESGQGVTIQSVAPITLKVEQLATVNLDIQVRATFANGWQLTKAQAECSPDQACQVTVSGPTSIMQGLGAYVVVDEPIASTDRRVPANAIRFVRNSADVDLLKILAFPGITWTPTTVIAHITASHGTETIQVALVDAQPSALPPAGYHVTAVIVSPLLITITGSPETLAGINSITLPAVSLAGYTSDHTFTLKITAPDPSVVLSVKTATVTYKIAPNPAVSPSP